VESVGDVISVPLSHFGEGIDRESLPIDIPELQGPTDDNSGEIGSDAIELVSVTEGWAELQDAERDAVAAEEDAAGSQYQASLDHDEGSDASDVAEEGDLLESLEVDETPEDLAPFHYESASVDLAALDVFESEAADIGDFSLDPDFGVFEYDPEARQRPWEVEPKTEDTVPRRAREKAASIAARIEFVRSGEIHALIEWLTELFTHLRHPSTFRAFLAAADEGATSEDLRAMVSLRQVWLERPDWWASRHSRLSGEIGQLRYGRSALTWALARRICRARCDFPPEQMIDEAWFDEWLNLKSGSSGYRSFPMYLEEKIASSDAESLDAGLRLEQRLSGYPETGDSWGWYRQVYDRDAVIQTGFRNLTPWDARSDRLRSDYLGR
jgi:hypothetical protein